MTQDPTSFRSSHLVRPLLSWGHDPLAQGRPGTTTLSISPSNLFTAPGMSRHMRREEESGTMDSAQKVASRPPQPMLGKLTSNPALRDYEGRVTDYTHELIEKISTFSGNTMNATAWFNYWSFDVMGDFAFGKSFNMLKTGKHHFAIDWLERSMFLLGLCSPIPWAMPVGAITPFVGSCFRRFIRWCNEQVDERRDTKTTVPDITSWLLKAAQDKSDLEATKWLHGDSRLLVVAGSDTVAIVLTYIFYYLARDPTHVQKIREELAPLVGSDGPFNVRMAQNAKHLNGVINEALRLHPPTPSGGFRMSPPQGITVDGVFIPGGVSLNVPLYSLGRCEYHHRRLSRVPWLTSCQRESASSGRTISCPRGGIRSRSSYSIGMASLPFRSVSRSGPLEPRF